MNTRTVLLGAIASLAAFPLIHAASIDRATLTEVVNSVSIIDPASKRTSSARTQQLFTAPNVLRTGADSRAEMVSPDQTVTRVGQSTLFSFEPNSREIQLQRGSILFQSPSGKGGGNIRTPAASAAVLGTTLIVTTTANGGFKVLLVEGKGRVKSGNTTRILKGGQMIYALPGGKLSGILEFRLSQQVSASRLVSGFKKNLPSAAKIQAAINRQEKDIASGRATATNLLASGSPNFAYRIDVARETVVQDALADDADPLTNAVTTDAVVDSPNLEEGRIFSDARPNGPGPGANFTSNFGDDEFIAQRAARPASFVANNITFDTPSIGLGQAADADLFQFLAINDIHFAQSADFGMFTGQELQLLAGGTFTAEPGTVVSANTPQLTMLALGSSFPLDGSLPSSLDDISNEIPLELTDFTLRNTGGNASLIGGEMMLTRVQLDASDVARITAAHNLLIEGDTNVEPVFDPNFIESNAPAGLSRIDAGKEARVKALGNAELRRVAIRAPRIRVTSEKVLKLTAVQLNDGSSPPPVNESPSGQATQSGPTDTNAFQNGVYLFGKELADLRRVNFFSNDVLIQSRTVRLESVRFRGGSRVILESALGVLADNPNTGGPVQPGKVNFVRNVQYGSNPAQDAVIQNGAAPTPSGPGIIIRPIRGRPSN